MAFKPPFFPNEGSITVHPYLIDVLKPARLLRGCQGLMSRLPWRHSLPLNATWNVPRARLRLREKT
jgi:hypothetical protein